MNRNCKKYTAWNDFLALSTLGKHSETLHCEMDEFSGLKAENITNHYSVFIEP